MVVARGEMFWLLPAGHSWRSPAARPRTACRPSRRAGHAGGTNARAQSASWFHASRTASRPRPETPSRKNSNGWRSQGHAGELPPAYFLAISGGGDNGAYGAGFLNGWTASGTRPEFKVVTGISTGALIAPFAFLGPKYDYVLERVYTTTAQKDIFKKRGIVKGIFGDAHGGHTPACRASSHPMSTASCSTRSRPNMRRAGSCWSARPTSIRSSP